MIQQPVKCSHKSFLFLSLFPYQFPVRPHYNFAGYFSPLLSVVQNTLEYIYFYLSMRISSGICCVGIKSVDHSKFLYCLLVKLNLR